jgi:hypothetical protein
MGTRHGGRGGGLTYRVLAGREAGDSGIRGLTVLWTEERVLWRKEQVVWTNEQVV